MTKRLLYLFAGILLCGLATAQQSYQPVVASEVDLPLVISITTVTQANVQIVGNPGTGSYYYWAVSNFLLGSSAPVPIGQVLNGPNTLSSSNQISITPNFYGSSATSVDILRTSTPTMPTGACNCAVATTVSPGAQTFDSSPSLSSYTIGPAISVGNYPLSLANEVVALGETHLILRQNGLFVCDLSIACGSASGLTIQTNGVNNISQTLINFLNSTACTWSNPSGGQEQVTCSGTGGVTGTGTAGFVPVWTGTNTLGNSPAISFSNSGNANPGAANFTVARISGTGGTQLQLETLGANDSTSAGGFILIQGGNAQDPGGVGSNVDIYSGANGAASTGINQPGQIIIEGGEDNSAAGVGAPQLLLYGGPSVNGIGGDVALGPDGGTPGFAIASYDSHGSFLFLSGGAIVRAGNGAPSFNCTASGHLTAGASQFYINGTSTSLNTLLYGCSNSGAFSPLLFSSMAPTIAGSSDVTARSTNQPTTNVVASALTTGNYRINYYLDQHAVCASGSNSVFLTFNWQDASNARSAQSLTLTLGSSQSVNAGYVQGSVPIYAMSSSAISYISTISGTCTTGGPSSYDVHVTAEAIP